MATGKFKKFTKAFRLWLEADAALVAIVGGDKAKIYFASGMVTIAPPCLTIAVVPVEPLVPDLDTIFRATMICTAHATTQEAALDIIDTLHERASMATSAPYADAAFSSDGIESLSIRPTGIRENFGTVAVEPNLIRADLRLRVLWRESA